MDWHFSQLTGLRRSSSPIMFTAFATLDTAVESVKRGAFDYLAKPFTADQLRHAAERALDHRKLQMENLSLREQLAANMGFDKIIGTSEAMQKLFGSEIEQRIEELALDLQGPYAQLFRDPVRQLDPTDWQERYLYGRSVTISSGTSEIMRNLLAQRALGLPR